MRVISSSDAPGSTASHLRCTHLGQLYDAAHSNTWQDSTARTARPEQNRSAVPQWKPAHLLSHVTLTLSAVSCAAVFVLSHASWVDCLAWSTLSWARPDTCTRGQQGKAGQRTTVSTRRSSKVTFLAHTGHEAIHVFDHSMVCGYLDSKRQVSAAYQAKGKLHGMQSITGHCGTACGCPWL